MRIGSKAARGCKGVVAVGSDAMASGAEVVVRARAVDGHGYGRVRSEVGSELMLIIRGEHIGLVVIGTEHTLAVRRKREALHTRVGGQEAGGMLPNVARGMEGVRPAEARAVIRRQFL